MSQIEKRIHYHDTDLAGVAYHANYLKYFEEGRADYMRQRKAEITEFQKLGLQFAVRKAEVDYRYPARYNDIIKVVSKVTELRNASLVFSQQVFVGDTLAVSAKIVLVCINEKFKPATMPKELADKLL